MTRLLPAAVACGLFIGLSRTAAAEPVTITHNQPYLFQNVIGVTSGGLISQQTIEIRPAINQQRTIAITLDSGSQAEASGANNSALASTTRLVGSGSTTAGVRTEFDAVVAESASVASFALDIAERQSLFFVAFFATQEEGSAQATSATWFAGLDASSFSFFSESGSQAFGGTPLVRMGFLNPGRYFLRIGVSSSASHNIGSLLPPGEGFAAAGYNFGLELQDAPVPEPSTLLLIGTGLAGTWLRRRKTTAI
jgi:hypothetical protein